MRIIKRAFWNVCKVYKKTTLMLFVIAVIMTLIFSGLALQASASQATKNAQKSVGAKVDFYPDYDKMMQAEFNGGIGEKTRLVDSEFVEELEKSNYVREIDYSLQAFASSNYHNGRTDAMTESGRDPFQIETDDLMEGKKIEFRTPTIYVKSLNIPENDLDFKSGKVKLVDGVLPAESEEENPVIVSKKFLERNDLTVGQRIEINGGDTGTAPVNVTIVGTFEARTSDSNSQSSYQGFMPEDTNDDFYSDMATTKKILMAGNAESRASIQYESVTVTLRSADDLKAFLKEFENKMGDTSLIKLSSEQKNLNQTLSAIENVGKIANTMVLITAIAAFIILGLLILLALRERKYEIGVLMSLGEGKLPLILQIVLETTLIMIAATLIAVGTSQFVAEKIEDQVVKQAVTETVDESKDTADLALDTAPIDKAILVKGLGIGFGIVFISSVMPMMLTLRKDPKILLQGRD